MSGEQLHQSSLLLLLILSSELAVLQSIGIMPEQDGLLAQCSEGRSARSRCLTLWPQAKPEVWIWDSAACPLMSLELLGAFYNPLPCSDFHTSELDRQEVSRLVIVAQSGLDLVYRLVLPAMQNASATCLAALPDMHFRKYCDKWCLQMNDMTAPS